MKCLSPILNYGILWVRPICLLKIWVTGIVPLDFRGNIGTQLSRMYLRIFFPVENAGKWVAPLILGDSFTGIT